MTEAIMGALVYEVVLYSVIASFVAYGLKQTIRAIMKTPAKEKLNRFVGIGLAYGFGMIFGFIMKNEYVTTVWYRIVFGIAIGATTVGIYNTVVKSLLGLIPNIVEKFFGDK